MPSSKDSPEAGRHHFPGPGSLDRAVELVRCDIRSSGDRQPAYGIRSSGRCLLVARDTVAVVEAGMEDQVAVMNPEHGAAGGGGPQTAFEVSITGAGAPAIELTNWMGPLIRVPLVM